MIQSKAFGTTTAEVPSPWLLLPSPSNYKCLIAFYATCTTSLTMGLCHVELQAGIRCAMIVPPEHGLLSLQGDNMLRGYSNRYALANPAKE
jgi:hypothetical protein